MGPVVIHAAAAKEYYLERDPLLNPSGNNKNAMWYGGGLAVLGLKEGERVIPKDFCFVVEGKDLEGRQLVQLTYADSNRTAHRAGLDFSFDDPKSVSVSEHVLHHKPDVIQNTRQAAVEKVIACIDQNYICYRQTKDGATTIRLSSGRGIIATFGHSLSRENDPQSHTHLIICNMVNCPDGKVRALSNEMIFEDQKYLTAIYHSEMAYSLARNGFAIEPKGKGLYSISGIDQRVIDKFSKRSHRLDVAVKTLREKYHKACEAELRKIAAYETRLAKDKSITSDQLNKSWSRQINKDLKMSEGQLIKNMEATCDRYQSQEVGQIPTALEFVTAAVRDLQKKEGTFRDKAMLTHSMSLSLGHYRETDISRAFNEACEAGIILHIDQNNFKSGLSEKVYSRPSMVKTVKETFHSLAADCRQGEKELKLENNNEPKSELSHSRGKVDDFIIERAFKIEREESNREYSRENDCGPSKQAEIEIGK